VTANRHRAVETFTVVGIRAGGDEDEPLDLDIESAVRVETSLRRLELPAGSSARVR